MNKQAGSKPYRYDIRLVIKHPLMRPEVFSKELALKPKMLWLVGTQRKTPTGDFLPGVHKESTWGYSARVKSKRKFFSSVIEMITRLEKHREFVTEIVETGGRVTILLHLPGDTNIGDVIDPHDLERLGRLQIGLSIEVFPLLN